MRGAQAMRRLSALPRAAGRSLSVAPLLRAPLCARRFASKPATADEASLVANEASGSATGSASAPAKAVASAAPLPPPPSPYVAAPQSSGAWGRLVAFATGVGVSSLWFYYTISADVWHSTAVIESSLAEFRKDNGEVNRELRERIAMLEHQVAALKK